MLLAEALAERAEAQNRIKLLSERLRRVARVREGEEPAEDPVALLEELEKLYDLVEALMRRIEATNCATLFDAHLTLSGAIARRDVALQRRRFYTTLADSASAQHGVLDSGDIRYRATVNVADLRAEADRASTEYRVLDSRIQQLNWATELLED